MASLAFLGSWLIEEDALPRDHFRELVTFRASDIFVPTLQSKRGALVVVEERGLPLGGRVTFRTGWRLARHGELPAVHIAVAALALRRCGAVIHVLQRSFQVRRTMTTEARDRAVGAGERITGCGMVELRQIFPGLRGMAGLAAGKRAVGSAFGHEIAELAAVRVGVADGAGKVFKAIRNSGRGRTRRGCAMTLHTGDREVAAGESEARLLVPRDVERGRMVALQRVTVFAAILVRRGGELLLVGVGVAVRAERKLHLVVRGAASGQVTFRARHRGVLAIERVGRCGVLLHSKLCGLETFEGVAGGTITAVRALQELSAVRVGGVAVRALLVGHGLLELRRAVTLAAWHGRVFSLERVLCFGVVKFSGERKRFPSAGVVTILARGGKGSAVRIGVARGAFVESDAGKLHHFFRAAGRAVTFLAGDWFVPSGERVARLRVVEARERFPAVHVVAALAIAAELAAVGVRMARQAIARQPEECARQQLFANQMPLSIGDVLWRVTAPAIQPGVLSFQGVAGLGMVKPFGRGIPFDEIEIFAIVLGVAGDAGLAGCALGEQSRVQAAAILEAVGDERVAVQAFEGGTAGTELVTSRAHGRPGERLMSTRKRSRRDLRAGRASE